MEISRRTKNLCDIFIEKQLRHVVSETTSPDGELISYDLRPASRGLCGFLGDHYRLTLHVRRGSIMKDVLLFIKTLPLANAPKAKYIDENDFFRKEAFMLRLFQDLKGSEGPEPWCVKAYITTENVIAMPDVAEENYIVRPVTEYLDYTHLLVTLSALARFHAAFANYETQKRLNTNHNFQFSAEYGQYVAEAQFIDTPWLHAGAKVTADFFKQFSAKANESPENLEVAVRKIYLDACKEIRDYDDTLNVIVHKDLWVNNILFKYDGDKPSNAILIDFQTIRYAPPAFDIMILLYYTTSRRIRESYEKMLLDHYYSVFIQNISEDTEKRLKHLDYNRTTFFEWCEKARAFGMVSSLVITPFILMGGLEAQETFDNPDTFEKHVIHNRSEPVMKYAKSNEMYARRYLELVDEFADRYLLKNE